MEFAKFKILLLEVRSTPGTPTPVSVTKYFITFLRVVEGTKRSEVKVVSWGVKWGREEGWDGGLVVTGTVEISYF